MLGGRMRESVLWSRRFWINIVICTGFLVDLLYAPAFARAQNDKLEEHNAGQRIIRTFEASQSVNTPAPVKEAWYFPVVPPPGDGAVFYVGPYKTLGGCRDMYGSAIYSHPFACHFTGPHPPSNCRNIGNGFAYPKDYPYPVPPNDAIVGLYEGCDCMKRARTKDDPKTGWYFLFYGPNGSIAAKCKDYKADAKLSAYNPAYQVGYYENMRCPGAPCFSIGFDSACD
jgi:hypothetical protein